MAHMKLRDDVLHTVSQRLFGMQGERLPRDLYKKRNIHIQYTYKASQEYPFYSLRERLTFAEFLAFLPMQYAKREKRPFTGDPLALIAQSVREGVEKFKRYDSTQGTDLLSSLEHRIDSLIELDTLEKRISDMPQEELQQLQNRSALILNREEMTAFENTLLHEGKTLEEYILKEQFVLVRQLRIPRKKSTNNKNNTKSTNIKEIPIHIPQLQAVVNEYKKQPLKLIDRQSQKTIRTIPNHKTNDKSVFHPTLKKLIENKTRWEELFKQKGEYDTVFFPLFFEGLVEYTLIDSKAEVTKYTDASISIPFVTSLRFYRTCASQVKEQLQYKSATEILSYFTQKRTTHFFRLAYEHNISRKSFKEFLLISGAQSEEKEPHIDITDLFEAPIHSFLSPNLLQKRIQRLYADKPIVEVNGYIGNFRNIPSENVQNVAIKTIRKAREYLLDTYSLG